MSVIKVKNLGKKYMISHDRNAENAFRARSLRDKITHTVRGVYQRLRHPLSPNAENTEVEELWALRNLDFEIEAGDRVGIIGRNGAGKSTLLKVLSRITEPTTGRIEINGRVSSLLEVGTGFHPELSGRENIYLNGAILGMTRREIKSSFDRIVSFSEIEKFLDTPVKRYSSGMYVRLAFAVAAHLEPEILIVDEVLAVGDAQFQKKCLGKMEEVGEEGRTVLFVSHNMAAINSLCNRGIVLNMGELAYKGEIVESIHFYNEIGSRLQPTPRPTSKVQVNSIEIHPAGIGVASPSTAVDIEIEFTTPHRLPDCYLNLVIEDPDRRTVIHTRTDSLGVYPSFDPGVHTVQLHFDRICLRSGVYTVWFRLYCDIDDIYEVIDSEFVIFEVKGPQVAGLVDIPCEWSVDGQTLHSTGNMGQYE